MKTYDINTVKSLPIVDYLASLGVEVRHGRIKAVWHKSGGDNTQAVSIDLKKNLWHDFVEGGGGSVIDLCMKIEGLTFAKAVQALGSRFNIQPEDATKRHKRKPKPKIAPNWVVVSWCIIQADRRDELLAEATTLTDADRYWTRRVAELLTGKMRGYSLDDAVAVAICLYHEEEERANGRKGAK